jgi:hypothetical protein
MSCVPLFRCRTGLSKRAPDGPIHVPNTPPGPNTARTRLRATEIIVCLLACLFVLLCFSCVRILATRTRVHSRQHHLALVSAHFGIIITIPAVSSHQGFGQKAEDTPFSRYIGQPALQNSSLPHFVQSSMLLVWVTFLSQERNSTTFLSSWLRRHGVGAGGRAGRGWLVVGSREGPDPAGAKLHPGLDHDEVTTVESCSVCVGMALSADARQPRRHAGPFVALSARFRRGFRATPGCDRRRIHMRFRSGLKKVTHTSNFELCTK